MKQKKKSPSKNQGRTVIQNSVQVGMNSKPCQSKTQSQVSGSLWCVKLQAYGSGASQRRDVFFQVVIGLVRFCKVQQIFNYSHLSKYQKSKQRTIPWWECTSNTGPSQSMSGAGLGLMAASCSPPASGRTALVGALAQCEFWTLIHDFKLQPWNAAIENPELFLPLSSRSISIP